MNGFIKIPNAIFSYELSPAALFLYCAMLSKANVFNSLCITYAQLAQLCRMDPKTIRSAMCALEEKKLMVKSNRYNARGYIANRYTLTIPDGNWFKLQREVFTTEIKAPAFMVYCFIQKSMCLKRGGAFPSITAITNETGIKRASVCKAITYLNDYSFINRIRRRYKRTSAHRHNRYLPFFYGLKKGKKRWRSSKQPSLKKSNHKFKISDFLGKVKSFFKTFLNAVQASLKRLGVVYIFPNSS